VRVGIVSWNTADLLDRCLAALPDALDGVQASVCVVDNASADGSADVAASHPNVQVIVNASNRGYARAMNQALGDAGADVLIALNPDTEPPAGSLTALATRLLDRPDVGLVAPRLAHPDGALQHSAYLFPSPLVAGVVGFVPPRWHKGRVGRRFWLEGGAPHDQPTDVDWAIGAVHVIRAQAVDQARPYSERWFMYVEDLDLCWRLAESGWRRRLEADITVPHVGNAAGAQAWGGQQLRRWLPASYDWYAEAHGDWAMRWWAAVNTVGVAVHVATSGVAGVAGRRSARARARQLAGQLRLHAGAIVRRPDVPSTPPLHDDPLPSARRGRAKVRVPAEPPCQAPKGCCDE
jgi:GT2 family glycosyltransferase